MDWYSSARGGVNNNRYLTFKLAQDAMRTIAASDQESGDSLTSRPSGDFSVGADGYVDMYMISILATLFCATDVISGNSEVGSFTTIDLVVRTGSTSWEQLMKGIAVEAIFRYGSNALDCKTSQTLRFQAAFSSAKVLVQERLQALLDSFSTSVVEDMALLAAAEWEGMNELEADQLGCPACRWQTEQMSFHDNLAVQFRASLKHFIAHIMSDLLACGPRPSENHTHNLQGVDSSAGESVESLQEVV